MPSVTVKQRVVIISGDQHDEGIDGYGGKDFENRRVLRREWKTLRERSTSGRKTELLSMQHRCGKHGKLKMSRSAAVMTYTGHVNSTSE